MQRYVPVQILIHVKIPYRHRRDHIVAIDLHAQQAQRKSHIRASVAAPLVSLLRYTSVEIVLVVHRPRYLDAGFAFLEVPPRRQDAGLLLCHVEMHEQAFKPIAGVIPRSPISKRVPRILHLLLTNTLCLVPHTEALNQQLVRCRLILAHEQLLDDPVLVRPGRDAEVRVVWVEARWHVLSWPVCVGRDVVRNALSWFADLRVDGLLVLLLAGAGAVVGGFAAAAALEKVLWLLDLVAVGAAERACGRK
jgi:hypothetical protein